MQTNYDNEKWLEVVDDIDRLDRIAYETWRHNMDSEQCTYTGKIDLDFERILSLRPDKVPFHTPDIGNKVMSIHKGMEGNEILRHKFPYDDPIHQDIKNKFGIDKSYAILHVQEPGSLVGIHIDKYRRHMTNGHFDFSNTTVAQIYRAIIFCQDWQVGEVFMAGTQALTDWKQGDTYTFPWYVPHGSANGGRNNRYVIQCVGEKL